MKSYDLQLMISISRGNNELVVKLIRLFLRNTPIILRQLEMAYKEGELQRFKDLINEIRPSFGYFSIREVEADLELAERLAYINFTGRSMSEIVYRIIQKANVVMHEMEIDVQQNIGQSENHSKHDPTELTHSIPVA